LIGDAIERTSERGPETKFIDADGGLCLVTDDIMRRNLYPASKSHLGPVLYKKNFFSHN